MALFSCALASLGFLGRHIGQFYATCLVIGAVGNISQIGFAHAISTWFQEFRGRALGLVLAGDGIGLMIFSIIAQSMIDHSGWRNGYFVLRFAHSSHWFAPSILVWSLARRSCCIGVSPRSRGLDLAGGAAFL